GGGAGAAGPAGVGDDRDDAAPPPLDHAGQGGVHAVHDPVEVDREVRLPLVGGGVDEGGRLAEAGDTRVAGVVDQDVDRPGAADPLVHLAVVGDVEGQGGGRPAGLADAPGRGLGPLGHVVVHDDLGPGGGQHPGDPLPHALAGA